MASEFQDVLIHGRATQELAAVNDNQLVRLGEARELLNQLFQGNWNQNTTFTAGQMVNDTGSLYIANDDNQNEKPSDNPSIWRILAAAGQSAFLYVAYASDTSGTGFSLSPGSGLNYLAVLSSPTAISSLSAGNFAGLWRLVGPTAYFYVGYASDTSGTGFSLSPGAGLNYVAILNSTTEISSPSSGDFAGLWRLVGPTNYIYLAYASDTSGTGFSVTPGAGLNYVAILNSPTAISSPNAGNFSGLWKLIGPTAYFYVGYASDTSGTGFSVTPGSGLNYVALLNSATIISSPSAGDFAGLWRLVGPTSYLYVGYASANDGTGFSTSPGSGLNYVAILNSPTFISSPIQSDFAGLWRLVGPTNYIYLAYASDTSGTGFSLTPGTGLNYAAILNSPTLISSPNAGNFAGLWRLVGPTAYFYVGYASDASGTGFSLTASDSLGYVAILNSPIFISSPQASDFVGLWRKTTGPQGQAGQSAYLYVAYASANDGTGFSLSPSDALVYSAIKLSTTVIGSPQASDFAGLWRLTGATAYIYIGYASANDGTGFSLTPSDSLNYIAILKSATPIATPLAGNFSGLWKRYGAPAVSIAGGSPLTLAGNQLDINASEANIAGYVVRRDSDGNFSAGTIAATSVVVGGSAALTFSSGALNVNQPMVVQGITVGSIAGVLKASGGVIAGGATTDDLSEGATNQYFTAARVRSTALTGISSTNVLLATDTMLVAFGKLDNILGGNYPSGSVTGNLSISGNISVSGATTLNSSLNGILKSASGVVAGSATTDDLPVGATNLYWTQTLFNTAIAAIKNFANGLAPLDGSGKVPAANLPFTGAVTYGANSNSAMTALSAAKQGDFCFRSDTSLVYILQNNTPSVLSNWSAWLYPVASVNGATGAVTLTTNNVSEPVSGAVNLWFTNARADARITAQRGAASGICPLDANSLVPSANLPPVGNSIWVSTNANITALASALKGDLVNVTDLNVTKILSNNTPTSAGSWVALLYPVASVNGATGTVVLTTGSITTESGNLWFTNARAIASTLTGFAAGAGSVTSADTILTALQKHEAGLSGLSATYAPLAGSTFTGTLKFSGTSNPGFIANQLSATQIGSLATTAGNYGNIVYDTTNNQLKALVNGSFVVISNAAALPLTAGSGNVLSGTLYFQDGLASFLHLGNQWSQRASSANDNFDFQFAGGTVFTLQNSSSTISTAGGWKFNTANGYQLGGSDLIVLNASRAQFDWGSNWTTTTTSAFASWELRYNGQPIFTANQNQTISFPAQVHTDDWFDSTNGLKVGGTMVVSSKQNISLSGGSSGASGWSDSTAQNDFNALVSALKNHHGLISY